MKGGKGMKSTIKILPRVAAAVVLAWAIIPSTLAQQDGSAPGQRGGSNDSDRGAREREMREREMRERDMRDRDLRERQFNLRMLENEARKPVDRYEPRLAYTQIREDFARIQAVNNDLAQSVSRGGSLDLKFVAKSASEVKKRAERLKQNLALPQPEKNTKRPRAEVGTEPEQLKSSLSALGELVAGFVSNPIFKNAGVVDAQMSVKARRDLEEIVELSGGIKKSSERLSKKNSGQ